jgi:drug/metabolite transporter (DMT)-like permease
MSPFITYTLITFMVTYVVLLAVDLVVRRAVKSVLAQAVILGLLIIVLHLTVEFPTPKQAFGGASPLFAVCVILGMAAHYGFYMGENRFSWRTFVRPIVISPIVLLPLLGSILDTPELTAIQLISFGFLAFQNGFFWEVVLERERAQLEM